MRALINLTGQRFGKWIVLERANNDTQGRARWLCCCDCGRKVIVNSSSLRSGKSKGCQSCQLRRINTRHGQWGTRLYSVWQGIIKRCENPNATHYEHYGGRGIRVCSEWRKDFMIFREWALANGYEEGLTIDRIDNNGDYESNNCRFATRKEQRRNSRQNRLVRIGNETKLLCEWAEEAGIHQSVLRSRIRTGWPEHRLLEPVHRKKAKVH